MKNKKQSIIKPTAKELQLARYVRRQATALAKEIHGNKVPPEQLPDRLVMFVVEVMKKVWGEL